MLTARFQAIEDFSNKYYSTIPHAFGRGRAPMIDNDDILKREVAMLDTLSDMEVANAIMKVSPDKNRDADSVNLLDKRFQSLGLEEMTPLKKDSQEWRELSKYLIESSSSGHGLKFRLQDIFRVERPDEEKRLGKSEFGKLKDPNRRLLWHGSRTTNYGMYNLEANSLKACHFQTLYNVHLPCSFRLILRSFKVASCRRACESHRQKLLSMVTRSERESISQTSQASPPTTAFQV